jgi:hypothetical protein
MSPLGPPGPPTGPPTGDQGKYLSDVIYDENLTSEEKIIKLKEWKSKQEE